MASASKWQRRNHGWTGRVPVYSRRHIATTTRGEIQHYRAVVDPTTLAVRVADNHGESWSQSQHPTGGSIRAPPEDVNGNDFNTTGRTWSTTQTSTGYTIHHSRGKSPRIPGLSAPHTVTLGSVSRPIDPIKFYCRQWQWYSAGAACQLSSTHWSRWCKRPGYCRFRSQDHRAAERRVVSTSIRTLRLA